MQKYVGIDPLITIHVLGKLLAQKWPPVVSEIALYAELKLWLTLEKLYFCRTYEIIFSQNYYLKPNAVPLQFNDLIRNWDCFLPQRHKKTWNAFCSGETDYLLLQCLLKMQTVNSSETLPPRPHVTLPYTTLFTHHCETEAKNIAEGSCRKNWITRTTLCSEQTLHDVMLLYFAPHLSYGFYCLIKGNNKVKGYNNTNTCNPFWNANCYQFYTYRWIYSQHNYPRYTQLPKQKWKNITTFTTEHDKFK